MHQSTYTVSGGQKKLRLIAGDHFISLPIVIKKSNVKALLNNEVLEAGTLVTSDGKPVTTTESTSDAYGVIYQDVNFKNSTSADGVADNATETAAVFIHGVLYESEVRFNSDSGKKALEKAALKQIIFGA